MGAGRSQEATYELKASVPAGTYHFVLDSIVIARVDVKYELLHRRNTTNTVIMSWEHHWDPLGSSMYEAQPYTADRDGGAIEYEPGDLLVFRYTALSGTTTESYVPNGDGKLTNGRIPNITLPE